MPLSHNYPQPRATLGKSGLQSGHPSFLLGSNGGALFSTSPGETEAGAAHHPLHPEQATLGSRIIGGESQSRAWLDEPLATFAPPFQVGLGGPLG